MHFEEKMERMRRLHKYTSILMRNKAFKGSDGRWYIHIPNTFSSSLSHGSYGVATPVHTSGYTPESAINLAWDEITKFGNDDDRFICITNCPEGVSIPGDGPQVWVKWDSQIDDWVDIKPTKKALDVHKIPIDRIRKYKLYIQLDENT